MPQRPQKTDGTAQMHMCKLDNEASVVLEHCIAIVCYRHQWGMLYSSPKHFVLSSEHAPSAVCVRLNLLLFLVSIYGQYLNPNKCICAAHLASGEILCTVCTLQIPDGWCYSWFTLVLPCDPKLRGAGMTSCPAGSECISPPMIICKKHIHLQTSCTALKGNLWPVMYGNFDI